MLTIVWHLLVNGEMYVEDGFEKSLIAGKRAYAGHVPLEEMAEILRTAGYVVLAVRMVSGKKVFHKKTPDSKLTA